MYIHSCVVLEAMGGHFLRRDKNKISPCSRVVREGIESQSIAKSKKADQRELWMLQLASKKTSRFRLLIHYICAAFECAYDRKCLNRCRQALVPIYGPRLGRSITKDGTEFRNDVSL